MTDHVTPEEARPYELATWRADSWRWFANREPQQRILTVEECNILARETEMFARQFRSLAAQLEAAQEVIEAARKVQQGRDLKQPKHFKEFVTLLDAERDALARYDAARGER